MYPYAKCLLHILLAPAGAQGGTLSVRHFVTTSYKSLHLKVIEVGA